MGAASSQDDSEFRALMRWWKILEVIPGPGGGYWNIDDQVFDLTKLGEPGWEMRTNQWIERRGDTLLIKLDQSPFYWQVMSLSDHRLQIGLRRLDPFEDTDVLMFTLECEPLPG